MRTDRDPIMVLRFALHAGDTRLADLLIRLLGSDRRERPRVDHELRAARRLTDGSSALGERVMRAIATALGVEPSAE
jgi:hypothetical protein